MTEENRAVASTSLVLPWEAERKARAALRIAPLCPGCGAKLYVVTAIDAVGFACWDTINCNFKRLATPNLPLAWQNPSSPSTPKRSPKTMPNQGPNPKPADAEQPRPEGLDETACSRLADYLESPPPYRKHCTKEKLWLVLDAHGDSVLWSDQELAVDAAVEALNEMTMPRNIWANRGAHSFREQPGRAEVM